MKVLIDGAGVIGCFLAHTLCSAGQEVTLLARGAWKQTLEAEGLTIRHSLQRKTTVDHPRVIDTVDDTTAYDVVFAVMQHQQLLAVLPELSQVNAPLIVCVGNNMSACEMERAICASAKRPKQVLFGFQGTGGHREDGKVVCVRFGAGSMSIGGLHGEPETSIKQTVESLFAGTHYRLTWVPDMDAWYRCHLTLVLPACYLSYANGCDLRKASRAQRKLLLDAANEAFHLLKALGYGIYPPGEDAYYQPGAKRLLMAGMIFVMAKTAIGDLAASDHCRHAVTEMEGLDKAWMAMRLNRPNQPMAAFDALRQQMPKWEVLHRTYDPAQ